MVLADSQKRSSNSPLAHCGGGSSHEVAVRKWVWGRGLSQAHRRLRGASHLHSVLGCGRNVPHGADRVGGIFRSCIRGGFVVLSHVWYEHASAAPGAHGARLQQGFQKVGAASSYVVPWQGRQRVRSEAGTASDKSEF